MRRVIGMDLHRTFAEVVVWEDGRLRHAGRVDMTRSGLEGFARTLRADDEVVIEATGNAMVVSHLLRPHVARVVIANPLQVKAIAHAHVKTDKIDAGVLANLYAAGFLPEVWTPDAATERLRRLVARRNQVVRHRTRLKNETHAILHAHLVPPCPHADLFSRVGRAWLERQALPDDEHAAIKRHLRELDTLGEDLAVLDRAIGEATLDSPVVRRLLTVTGINVTVAAGLAAAIGDVRRFSSPQKLVSYFGLNPRVRQSGLGLAQHGRISKAGRSHARAMLVEAAWAAAKAPGPLHAFFVRVRARRGHQIAAVATARKLAVLCWHLLIKEADYLWARPALVANKIRGLELQAGQPQKKGNQRGPAYAYNVKALRDQEMEIARRAETAYERVVAHWTPRPSKAVRGRLKSARLE
ncbi:transposase [Streptomyces purpurogeneiscleroticus]|nr:transposase [Streptomyces purpurogeneiscleroticus]